MKHAIDEATRADVRGVITTIRTRHNCSRAEAEELFRRALSCHTDAVAAIIAHVDADVAEQKEDAKQYKDTHT
jgi:hypothetical protein